MCNVHSSVLDVNTTLEEFNANGVILTKVVVYFNLHLIKPYFFLFLKNTGPRCSFLKEYREIKACTDLSAETMCMCTNYLAKNT